MKKKRVTPYMIISVSFFLVILVGALLLLLPISTKAPEYRLSFVDALFMSTTSVCVTGLSVVRDIGTEFTVFGKIILCILMEIGGLSFLTIAIFCFILLGVKIGVGERLLLKESLNQKSTSGIIRLIKNIVIISFSIQGIGAIVNFLILLRYYPPMEALGIGIFHSISSFNNAGLDIFGNADSMITYKSDVLLNISTMLLIILGGIGFIVLTDLYSKIKNKNKRLQVHTKVVLTTTLVLIIGGAILLKLSSFKEFTWLQAIFHSVSCRTAGFATYDLSGINNASYIVMLFLMMVGASPCSTGGGIKTTTLAVIVVSIFYYARGKTPKMFNRKVANQSIIKAFLLLAICLLLLMISIFILCIVEKNIGIKEIVFEAVSAISTTGLSMGIASSLHTVSKLVIIFLMLFGRLGPLTVISMWNINWLRENDESIKYVEEKIIIG